MAPSIIQKKTDANVQKAKDIRDGKNKNFVFCEGEKNIEELLKSGWSLSALFCRSSTVTATKRLLTQFQRESPPIHVLSDEVMSYLSDLDTAPGFIALSKRNFAPRSKALVSSPLLLVLHELQLPQNVGALMRTAEAAGVNEIWLTQKTADAYSAKSIRGSSGSVFRMPIQQGLEWGATIDKLKQQNVIAVAADQNGTIDYDRFDWTTPVALVMGSEGTGFKESDLKLIPQTVRIPMLGSNESLNVGVAAAVCLFEAARQRRHKGSKS